jgi:hypothetical protein
MGGSSLPHAGKSHLNAKKDIAGCQARHNQVARTAGHDAPDIDINIDPSNEMGCLFNCMQSNDKTLVKVCNINGQQVLSLFTVEQTGMSCIPCWLGFLPCSSVPYD